MEQKEKMPVLKRLKIIIIVLAVLLVLSAGGLTARYVYLQYFAPSEATVAVPDNLIGDDTTIKESSTLTIPASPPASKEDTTRDNDSRLVSQLAQMDKPAAAKLELYAGKPYVNQRFEVHNMFPGDTQTQFFCVKAYHDADLELFFCADIVEQTKDLGEVLHIKVTHLDTGKVLCDAPFSEVSGKGFSELLETNGEKATTSYYQIDVSLDTSVGNEYQVAMLKADFEWYAKNEDDLIPPQTSDALSPALWITLAASLLLMVLLLALRRRKEDGRNEE